jgi:hypothetical protein
METLLLRPGAQRISLADVEGLAKRYRVPVGDVLLIGVNLFGINSERGRRRARLQVTLATGPSVSWQVIVPLNAAGSPFTLIGDELRLGGVPVGAVRRVDADEAVGGYFRNGGRAATLNPNARSRCVGCAFCPNTLEAAADPRMAEDRKLGDLLRALAAQHPAGDLARLEEVTVSTGCFERERAAVDHLVSLRSALARFGAAPRIGFLTSVIRTPAGLATLRDWVAPFVLRLTAECFTRRDLLLKSSKARLQVDAMPGLLRQAGEAGLGASFTCIVGLDDMESLQSGIASLAPYVSEFPNFQVYQVHNAIMAGLRAAGADQVEFYLRARARIEALMGPTGLRPAAWEGYRPLWYYTFAGESLVAA